MRWSIIQTWLIKILLCKESVLASHLPPKHNMMYSINPYHSKLQPSVNLSEWLRDNSVIITARSFYLHVRFSYLGLLCMRASILHPFSHAEQHLMHLHYCKGRFRVVVGVYTLINHNLTDSIFRCWIVLPTVLMGGSKIWQSSTNQNTSTHKKVQVLYI